LVERGGGRGLSAGVSPGCRLLRHQPDGGTVPKDLPARPTKATDNRSSITGRFVSNATVARHPNTESNPRCLLGRQKNKSSVGWLQSVRWIQSSVRLATVLGASSGRSFPASSTKANSTRSANRAGFAQRRRQVTNEQREQRRKLGLMGTFGGAATNGPRNGRRAAGYRPEAWRRCKKGPLTRAFPMEWVTRIELA
jgi:hypothetical protein